MRLKNSVWIGNISLIITGDRQVDLNGGMLETVLLDLDGKGITVKDMHYLHGTWESLDMEHSGHQKWNCAALICMYSSSISQRLSQEMRLSLSLQISEQAAVNTSLILIQEDWVVLCFLHWAGVVDSWGYSGQWKLFLFFKLLLKLLYLSSVKTPQHLTIMTYWRLLHLDKKN